MFLRSRTLAYKSELLTLAPETRLPVALASEQDTMCRLQVLQELYVERRGRRFILDDSTKEYIRKVASWLMNSKKRGLLLHRYDRCLTTVIATNLDLTQLEDRYGDRVTDRLFETLVIFRESDSKKQYRALFTKEGDVFVTADTDIHTLRQAEKYLGRKSWKKVK